MLTLSRQRQSPPADTARPVRHRTAERREAEEAERRRQRESDSSGESNTSGHESDDDELPAAKASVITPRHDRNAVLDERVREVHDDTARRKKRAAAAAEEPARRLGTQARCGGGGAPAGAIIEKMEESRLAQSAARKMQFAEQERKVESAAKDAELAELRRENMILRALQPPSRQSPNARAHAPQVHGALAHSVQSIRSAVPDVFGAMMASRCNKGQATTTSTARASGATCSRLTPVAPLLLVATPRRCLPTSNPHPPRLAHRRAHEASFPATRGGYGTVPRR
jgi:hypothetical protein